MSKQPLECVIGEHDFEIIENYFKPITRVVLERKEYNTNRFSNARLIMV